MKKERWICSGSGSGSWPINLKYVTYIAARKRGGSESSESYIIEFNGIGVEWTYDTKKERDETLEKFKKYVDCTAIEEIDLVKIPGMG